MDWALCIVCQQPTSEALRCPLNASKDGLEDLSGPYKAFLDNVNAFRELNKLPVALIFEEDINVDQLVRHRAQWHKSCHTKFNRNKLERAQKRERSGSSETGAADRKQLRQGTSLDKSTCIFCRKSDGHLHEFMTMKADNNVRAMATDMGETELLTRIEGGDLIALDAKYHLDCLTGFRNRHRSLMRQSSQGSESQKEEKKMEARAFVELITNLENCVEGGQFHFKFSSLRDLYKNHLLDFDIHKEINKVRFKEQVLKHFPYAQEQNDGKNAILVFEQGVQEMLKQALKCDYEEDALILSKAAKIVRRDIFESNGFKFNASFPSECQQDSVPTYLKSLVSMMLIGVDLKDQNSADSQACLTVSQTILFNCKKRAPTSGKSRHSLDYEPPLPLYIGLSVHTQTRSKKLITRLYELGLSVSYDRVVELENQLTTAICENIAKKGVVCPAQLRKGLFTVSALDNIDHNPTALPIFHCYTGCDTTSSFCGKGKKSAWEAWKSYPEVTQAFNYMAENPHTPVTIDAQHFKLLERYTVILYDKSSNLESVNEARREMFCQKNKPMEHIPPTQDSLLQHTKRVAYQSGIWVTSDLAQQLTSSPQEFGWTLDGQVWLPVWSTLPMASKACSELVKCGCKSTSGCGARCSCMKAHWKCTELCSCNCKK